MFSQIWDSIPEVEQGASSGDQEEEKGPWNVERGTGHLERIQECGQSMQGCDEEGQGPPGIEAGMHWAWPGGRWTSWELMG